MEDALKDAQGEVDLLELYGGTSLLESQNPVGRPINAHQRAKSQQQLQQQQSLGTGNAENGSTAVHTTSRPNTNAAEGGRARHQ